MFLVQCVEKGFLVLVCLDIDIFSIIIFSIINNHKDRKELLNGTYYKYFDKIPKIEFKGAQSEDSLSFKFYDASKIVLGKSMEENLRIASCYWHSFSWPGGDPFGGPTFQRPWTQKGDAIEMAKLKLENAFDFFEKLGQPYFCFHDADIAPEGSNFAETEAIQKTIVDAIQKKN